jgi:hypothetical protein
MKMLLSSILIILCLAMPAAAAEFDFVKVKGVDNAMFRTGSSSEGVLLIYIVDRTTGMCFAMTAGGHGPAGVTKIDCEPLKKIEVIKTYIETGKLP